ncbi:dihydroxyacetone kinase subunit DhaL [Streptantibioticus silvisoli]|uniref:Dihydroxyacetone kinase subunit DhaL n=1 Tax=Streptantibioticus silvisoli TaxID=2705255 RepID=A0ABT6W7I8_9ACTN|nr:dihydroxyacetone kinase subunit DhaL [Streptantibioticus silvisoli]MDI5966717.1 dihydroxyacetone kinase subunit DhaL [Streptantibioticus silvisoli]
MNASATPDAGPPAGPSGPVIDAAFVRRWLSAATNAVDREADRLTELDSAIGDADHGANLRRGFTAASAAVDKAPPDTPGGVLFLVGRQLISTVGGASGPLYGTLLRTAGKELGDGATAAPQELSAALRAGVEGVGRLGGAAPGDKTMLDALIPAVDALASALESGAGLVPALAAARIAANEGAQATVPLQARKGRASYLGPRSVGHQDPGATSAALLVSALCQVAEATDEESAA